MEEMRYKLRRKAYEGKTFYTDRSLKMEHKGVIALVNTLTREGWLDLDTGFTVDDLAAFSYEDKETVNGLLLELDRSRYVVRIPYRDGNRK